MLTIDMYPPHSSRKQIIGTHGGPTCGSPATSTAATAMPAQHSAASRRSV